ncbi:MAG: hypothetical protein O7C61_04040 [SAR324 cluster bacterium]|nr:hypothetical protein [SAR324 cluster bacterium]MCZ6842755.1 hypothetical protein [SAR324 cluster bacterium]
MSTTDDLLSALDAGTFDTALEGVMGSLDKNGLTQLMNEMDAKSAGIPDQTKRHLLKNGIASLKMTIDTM